MPVGSDLQVKTNAGKIDLCFLWLRTVEMQLKQYKFETILS